MNLYENVMARKTQLEKMIALLEKRFPTYPDGSLHFQSSNGKPHPYQVTGSSRSGTRKRRYLNSGSRNVAELLARKYCDELCLIDYRRELAAVNAYLREFGRKRREIDKIFDSWELYAPYLKQKAAVLSAKENTFLNEEWEQSREHPESLTSRVSERLTVRSKSEGIIAVALEKRGLSFRYECITEISGYRLAPDFTIFSRKLNRPVIWEHFGMMDDEKYRDDAARKISAYIRAGYTPHKDIIFTFETKDDPFTIEQAERILKDFFD